MSDFDRMRKQTFGLLQKISRKELHERVDGRLRGHDLDLAPEKLAVEGLETAPFAVLGAERLDDGRAADGLLLEAGEVGDALLSGLGVAADALAEDHHRPDADREDEEAHGGEFPVADEQGRRGENQDEGLLHEVADDLRDAPLDELGVVEGAAHELAGAGAGEVEEREAHDFREELVAQVHDGALGDPFDEVLAREEGQAAQQDRQQQQDQQGGEGEVGVVHVAGVGAFGPGVGGFAEGRGLAAERFAQAALRHEEQSAQRAAEEHARREGQDEAALVGAGEGEDAPEEALLVVGEAGAARGLAGGVVHGATIHSTAGAEAQSKTGRKRGERRIWVVCKANNGTSVPKFCRSGGGTRSENGGKVEEIPNSHFRAATFPG